MKRRIQTADSRLDHYRRESRQQMLQQEAEIIANRQIKAAPQPAQPDDMQPRDVLQHILQVLCGWPEYNEGACYREKDKMVAIRRNGQRFEIKIREIERGRRFNEV